jgi:hypothetical protein
MRNTYFAYVILVSFIILILSVYGSAALCWTLVAFSDSWSFTQSVGLFGRGISPSQCSYLHTGQHKQNKRTQTSMPQVGFEPMIPVFERAKTILALGSAATVIGGHSN